MHAVRVVLEGTTTSFRFPHFLVGRQPTFPMPPPSTIYGHICSALGELVDPASLQFAYHFQYTGRADDVEAAHLLELGSGRMDRALGAPKNVEATLNPLRREVLLHPRLTLYVSSTETAGLTLDRLQAAFREPYYCVALGRSQDLAAYRSVDRVDLVQAPGAYFEGTLLPWEYRWRTGQGIPLLLPRHLDPNDRQVVHWASYVVLERRIFLAPPGEEGTLAPASRLRRLAADEQVWVDRDSPPVRGLHRAVVWHGFIGGE
jgi:CRISPR-associated protein Cas5t